MGCPNSQAFLNLVLAKCVAKLEAFSGEFFSEFPTPWKSWAGLQTI
jgi:hypothetical protein